MNASIEAGFDRLPTLREANGRRQGLDVKIWVRVAEAILGSVKQILPIDKRDRAFPGRLSDLLQRQIKNPAGGSRHVQRGANSPPSIAPALVLSMAAQTAHGREDIRRRDSSRAENCCSYRCLDTGV